MTTMSDSLMQPAGYPAGGGGGSQSPEDMVGPATPTRLRYARHGVLGHEISRRPRGWRRPAIMASGAGGDRSSPGIGAFPAAAQSAAPRAGAPDGLPSPTKAYGGIRPYA